MIKFEYLSLDMKQWDYPNKKTSEANVTLEKSTTSNLAGKVGTMCTLFSTNFRTQRTNPTLALGLRWQIPPAQCCLLVCSAFANLFSIKICGYH